ncbi:MAG: alpha/beta hydrolase [Clostridiales bacterium]|nr:alpha/beta hydrolase [Clostridiales bacterium]
MTERDASFRSADGKTVPVCHWAQEGDIRGAVLLVHGMAEHAGRYERLACALARDGLAVYAPDLRGHGRAIPEGVRGSLGPRNGWERALDDLLLLTDRMRSKHPGAPVFLFGHSMGSLFGRVLLMRHGERFAAAVLSGVFVDKPVRRTLAPLLASAAGLRRMEQPNRLLHSMTCGQYNKPFEGRTAHDWISSIPEEVDRYTADPLCGFVCSAALYRDIGVMLRDSLRSERIRGVPDGLPVLFTAGADDPLGGRAAVGFLISSWRKHGKNAYGKVYPGCRHEVHSDVAAGEFARDVRDFLLEALRGGPAACK